jgi:hypothetical protein
MRVRSPPGVLSSKPTPPPLPSVKVGCLKEFPIAIWRCNARSPEVAWFWQGPSGTSMCRTTYTETACDARLVQDGHAWLHILKAVARVDTAQQGLWSKVLFGYYHTWLAPIEEAIFEFASLQTAISHKAAASYCSMLTPAHTVREWAIGYERGGSRLQQAVDLLGRTATLAHNANKFTSGKTGSGRSRKMMTIWGHRRFEVTTESSASHTEVVAPSRHQDAAL